MAKITHEQLEAMAQHIVDAMPEPSPEQARKVAAVLHPDRVPNVEPVRMSAR